MLVLHSKPGTRCCYCASLRAPNRCNVFVPVPDDRQVREKWTEKCGFPFPFMGQLCIVHFNLIDVQHLKYLNEDACPNINENERFRNFVAENSVGRTVRPGRLIKCVACGVSNKNISYPLNFYPFPKSWTVAQDWAAVLGLSQQRLHKILAMDYPKICDKHFDDDQFERYDTTRLFLQKHALPKYRCYPPSATANVTILKDSIAAADATATDLGLVEQKKKGDDDQSLAARWASLAEPGWTGETVPCPICNRWFEAANLKHHIADGKFNNKCRRAVKLYKCYFCGVSCTGHSIGSHVFEQHEQIGPFGLSYSPEEQPHALIDMEGNVRQLEKWLCHLCGFMINGTRQQMHLHFTSVHQNLC